jgi:hypothetical protein
MVDGVDTGETWPRGRHLLPLLAVAALCLNVLFIVWYSVSGGGSVLPRRPSPVSRQTMAMYCNAGSTTTLSKLAAVRGIELELTEAVLMEATQKHSATLQRLHRLGAKSRSTISAPAIRRSNISPYCRSIGSSSRGNLLPA